MAAVTPNENDSLNTATFVLISLEKQNTNN